MKRTIATALFLLLVFIIPVPAEELFLAPLFVYTDAAEVDVTDRERAVTHDIYTRLREADTAGLLSFTLLSPSQVETAPRSSLEAARLGEELQVRYILYGYVKKTTHFYDAQLRLFDNRTKRDQHAFYAKAGLDSFALVADSLSEQTVTYTRDLLGITPERVAARRRFGGVGLHWSAGSWFPLGDWNEVATGIATGGIGVSVIPATPLARGDRLSFFARYGLYGSYSIAVNRPGYIDSTLHGVLLETVADFCLEYERNHVGYIGLGPMIRLDTLRRQPLYEDERLETTASPGLTTRLGYEYWFERKRQFALGLQSSASIAMYNDPLTAVSFQLYGVWRLDLPPRRPISRSAPVGGME